MITSEEILKQIKDRGLKQRDLVELTGFEKGIISKICNGKAQPSNGKGAAFYYLFQYLDQKIENEKLEKTIQELRGGMLTGNPA